MTTEAPATEVPAPQTFKVFAGNLAFATTDDSLKQFFAGSGEVVDAHVVTRGNRSVGYGFVDYPTLDLAEKAVKELDKQTLDGRTINVELARARDESAPAEGGEGGRGSGRRRGRGRGRGGRGAFRGPPGPPIGGPAAGGPAAGAPYQPQFRPYRGGYYAPAPYYDGGYYYAPGPYYEGGYQAPRGARAPRPGRRARQHEGEEEPQQQSQQPAERRPRREPREPREPRELREPREPREPREFREPREPRQPREPREPQEGGEEVAYEGEEGFRGRRRGRGGFRRGGRGRGAYHGDNGEYQQAPPAEGEAPSEFRGRGRRRGGRGGRRFERKPRDENQEPSATTLFIANLPYDLNEEGLMAVFKDYQPQQARIARARGRSKGFGFIQLENHELQQKAAAEIDNTEVQGRVLNVKPAVVDLSVPQEEEKTEAEAQPAQ